MPSVRAYAAQNPKDPIAPFTIERREPGPSDVAIDILFCGICHSDLHQVRDEWGGSLFPMVPGHEIVGKVTAVGSAVTKLAVGQLAGVGCMVDSCRTCGSCKEDLEQFCSGGATFTYNVRDKQGALVQGGYSKSIVVDEAFVLRVDPRLSPASAAPLLCAGITTYSPLRHWKVGPGMKVGVVGLGGLGHMGLKFAKAFGATVVQFTTSPKKREDALRLGADDVILSTDEAQMAAHAGTFDFILNTVSAPHALEPLLFQLKRDGTMVLVGVPDSPPVLRAGALIFGRRSLAGSLIGGIAETQEMLDFCAEHGIAADVEVIAASEINTAYERMLRGDVKYRFAIDCATI
jgi:uncharacterized zinc-type alcohol dehydrogenase-like protein